MRRLILVDGMLAAVAGAWLITAAMALSPALDRTAMAAKAQGNTCAAPATCPGAAGPCVGCVPGPQIGTCQSSYWSNCIAGAANCSGAAGATPCNCAFLAC